MNCLNCGLAQVSPGEACPRCGTVAAPSGGTDGASPWARPDSTWGGTASDPTQPLPTVPPTAEAVEPTLAFGSPQQYAATAAANGTLPPPAAPAWAPPAAPPRKRRRLPILLLALALVVVGGGVAAAGVWFGWFGSGGKRPSDVVPAATFAYLQLDLNPSMAQKTQAWEFLRELPQVKKAVAAGQTDPKRLLWDLVPSGWIIPEAKDYDKDLAPWLGDRLGVAVLNVGDRQTWITAVQVTDEAKGIAQLRTWIGEQDYDVTARDGYALITMGQDTDVVLAELAKGTLAADPDFASDLAALGDPGVALGWADASRNLRLEGDNSVKQGRTAFALRFSSNTMTLDGRFTGLTNSGANGSGRLGELPATTGAGISVSGGARLLDESWPAWGQYATGWLQTYGLDQADLAAVLGRNLTVSVPVAGIGRLSGLQQPEVGLQVVTDDVKRARSALQKVNGSGVSFVDRVDGDVLTAASSEDYFAELTGTGPKLATSEVFTRAVPDHAEATAAFYVDLAPFFTSEATGGGEYAEFAQALKALGGEYLDRGSGTGSWSVRLVRT